MSNISKISEYDFIVAIDTSGSMGEPVKAGSSITRWEAVQESALTIIRDVEKLDGNGIGLVLFGGPNIKSFDDKATRYCGYRPELVGCSDEDTVSSKR